MELAKNHLSAPCTSGPEKPAGHFFKDEFHYANYAHSAAFTQILRPTKPGALGLSCQSLGLSCAHLPVARADAELALEDAGEIREIVDADCVSDGLDQCSRLCTVRGNSTSMRVGVDPENRPKRTVLRHDRNNVFSSPAHSGLKGVSFRSAATYPGNQRRCSSGTKG